MMVFLTIRSGFGQKSEAGQNKNQNGSSNQLHIATEKFEAARSSDLVGSLAEIEDDLEICLPFKDRSYQIKTTCRFIRYLHSEVDQPVKKMGEYKLSNYNISTPQKSP